MEDPGASDGRTDEQLIRYLLGMLSAGETETFDELSITDETFVDRLRVVEDDLFDAYARGDLALDARRQFEYRYLSLPSARERLRFAEALVTHQGRTASTLLHGADRSSRSLRRARVPAWALAAAASILLAVAGYVELAKVRTHRQQAPPAVVANQPPPGALSPLPVPGPLARKNHSSQLF